MATPTRPRDVVLASALTIFGSVFALAGVFTAQGELNNARVRREIETMLADERFSAVDISVDTVLTMVRVGLMGASTASVAAIVLAVFILRRHNPSRIALTVLGGFAAVTVLLSGLAGVVIAAFLAYTVSLLWRAPVRGWFAESSASGAGAGPNGERPSGGADQQAGRPGKPGSPGQQPGPSAPQPGPYGGWSGDQQQPDPYRPQPGQQPGPYAPQEPEHPGQPAYPPYPQPYGYGYGYGHPQGFYGYPAADPNRRPPQVVTAHVLTWVGVAFGLFTGVFFLVASGSGRILDVAMGELGPAGLGEGELVMMLRLAGVVMALWSLAVAVVSVFSWRRARWAAIVLSVMGGAYVVLQLVALASGQVAVLFPVVYVVAVLVLLWWPTSRQWYAARGGPGEQGHHAGPPGPHGGPPYPQERRRNQPW